jgi:hypothetical protein
MKKLELKQLIKEEINKILTESELKDTPLKDLKPGKYNITYTIDGREGVEDSDYTLTEKDITLDINPQNFWKGIARDNNLFTKRDSVKSVKKL